MRHISCLPAAVCCLIIGLYGQPVHAAPQAPSKGMPMDKVTQIHGQPRVITAAVGDPPITRWIYDEYTVYFEHKHVIHSVITGEGAEHPVPSASAASADRDPVTQ